MNQRLERASGDAAIVKRNDGRRGSSLRAAGRRWAALGALGAVVVIVAACSSAASQPKPTVLQQRPAGSQVSGTAVSAAQAGSLGTVLVDRSGFTLYRFAPDGTGKPTCTGGCAMAWPPLTSPTAHIAAGTGVDPSALGTVARSDGSLQVTFHGMPLYRFKGDTKPGDTSGQGVAGTWFVVPASGAGAQSAPTATTGAAPPTTTPAAGAPVPHPMSQSPGSSVPPVPAATAPPATVPPAAQPPVTQPPATAPPATVPPATQPMGGYGY